MCMNELVLEREAKGPPVITLWAWAQQQAIIHTFRGAISRNACISLLFRLLASPMKICGMNGCISLLSQMMATCVKHVRVALRLTSCLTSSPQGATRMRTLPASSPFHKHTLVSSRFRRNATFPAGHLSAW